MRLRFVSIVVAVAVASLVMASIGSGATSTIDVSMDVPSATTISNSCTQTPAWNLGTVLPSARATTATDANVCHIGFGSSNDTSMLRIRQHDTSGAAMSGSGAVTSSSGSLVSVDAFDATNAAAITEPASRRLLVSTNGGASWTMSSAAFPVLGNAVAQVGASTVLVVGRESGASGTIQRSTDSGATWSAPTTNPTPAGIVLQGIDTADNTTIYAAGDQGVVLKSSDGGSNWTLLDTSVLGAGKPSLRRVSSPSASVVWVSGSDGRVIVSQDGGASFTVSQPGATNMSVDAVDGVNGWAAGVNGSIYRTSNAGASWSNVSSNLNSSWLDVVATDASHALVSGQFERYGLVRAAATSDSGATWSAVSTSGFAGAISQLVVVPGSGAVLACGETMGVLLAPSLGSTMTISNQNGTVWRAVDAWDVDHLVIVGAQGNVVTTTNRGATRTPRTSGTTQHLNGVGIAPGTDTVWAVGAAGTVLRSTDAGVSWTPQVSNVPTTTLQAVVASDAQHAWAVGGGGVIIATADGGATWSTQTSSTTNDLYDIDRAGGVLFAGGLSGTARMSTDDGATWQTVTAPAATTITHVSLVDSTRWFMTQGGTLRITANAGSTWTQGLGGSDNVDALDARNLWMSTGFILQSSSDGGITRNRAGAAGSWTSLDILALDSNIGFAVGNRSQLYALNLSSAISDYNGTTSSWGSDPVASNTFGVCLQAIGGTASTGDWSTDSDGQCTAADTDPWHGIPSVPTGAAVAKTTATGATGSADLVFGFRASEAEPPGTYTSTIDFLVVAPGV